VKYATPSNVHHGAKTLKNVQMTILVFKLFAGPVANTADEIPLELTTFTTVSCIENIDAIEELK
jgi:hypothetical protein